MSQINYHGSFNKDEESDELCESFAQINLKNGTNDPSHPSDKHHVNDMSGNKAYMNCYLTALVGNSGVYNKLGAKRFASDFNIKVTETKDLYEISELYTGLGEDEGYKEMKEFNDKDTFIEFINNECEQQMAKKYIFLHCLSAEESRQLYEVYNIYISGHILSLKTRQATNGQWMYLFIDYQKEKTKRERARNKLPKNAFPPFYVFEKIKY